MHKKRAKGQLQQQQQPYSNAGEAIGKMLVERRISTKINYDVLRDIEIDVKGQVTSSKPVAHVVDMGIVADEKIAGELHH